MDAIGVGIIRVAEVIRGLIWLGGMCSGVKDRETSARRLLLARLSEPKARDIRVPTSHRATYERGSDTQYTIHRLKGKILNEVEVSFISSKCLFPKFSPVVPNIYVEVKYKQSRVQRSVIGAKLPKGV